MSLDELAHLLLREPHRVFKKRAVRFHNELDHALWILAALAGLPGCSTIYESFQRKDTSMNGLWRWFVIGPLVAVSALLCAQEQGKQQAEAKVVVTGPPPPAPPAPPDSITHGTVTVGGQAIAYRAVAGTLTVGATDPQDAMLGMDGKLLPDTGEKPPDPAKPEEAPPTARMFYTAYFKKDAPSETRPVTFLYNGGPGSATMWLHMGSFGPRRVLTTDTQHDPGAPYKIVNNEYSLLDASDLVFIDAPGTGFSRIMGKDKEKAFWGTDQDAHAFERFIRRFLTKFDRWNSPKYLFGESYGTPRSAVLSAMLHNVDLNGIVLLSAILSFDNWADGPRWNPGVEQPYALALPTLCGHAPSIITGCRNSPPRWNLFSRRWRNLPWASTCRRCWRARNSARRASRQWPRSCTSTPACRWRICSNRTCA